MATSLTQQLNQLRVKQRDQVVLPSRTKISFLFDIKKAANVDDQSLYYLCQQGLTDLSKEEPRLENKIKDYAVSALLGPQSLNFYRG